MSDAQITPTVGNAELTGAEDEMRQRLYRIAVAWVKARDDDLVAEANNTAPDLRHKASQ